MSDRPRVSFIVLSYNYESYIVKTIQSILDQTFSDFEVVVVDDASSDRSREVIRSFADSRVRLYVNERNLGGAGSYNRAIGFCRGDYLANLDADDWIDRRKTEIQLGILEHDPSLDIVGTYVSYVDAAGNIHPRSTELESYTNRLRDLNLVSNWIALNVLCRSSTMMRRSVHDRIGLDDATMVREPDYELWTRALYNGCRFYVLPEQLTFYRFHEGRVTHGDPAETFLEICYLMQKNLIPIIEKRATFDCFCKIIDWIISQDQFVACEPEVRYRLLGTMMLTPRVANFSAFRNAISARGDEQLLTAAGRRLLVAYTLHPRLPVADRFAQDIDKYVEARDYWHGQSDIWEREYRTLKDQQLTHSEYRLTIRSLTQRLRRWMQAKLQKM